ncbi:hypothetical protein C0J08_05260 [Marinomonas sp. CT5]|uniref:hypothetical protein n=1 Tax=Marinomonas sp. CT5 TaxID=2066133 RepID=UPI0017C46EEA|nr:hypothetical protein [Marinomonas sp. CT5]NVK75688.1 hypothetical protein [Oceanospirillaceae bacterium]QUX94853.1 hypothetical protein C0J08_05260 [Marinomonas sp. CT5]
MQTDIEIYVLSCPTANIIAWLEETFTLISQSSPSNLCTKAVIEVDNHKIEVTILEQAAGKRFTSIWFNSDKTPWEDDITCAKQAFRALNCEVRCNFQGWEEEGNQDPDQWWRINSHGEGPFIWN